MCGFAFAYVRNSETFDLKNRLEESCSLIKHRGPDNSSLFFESVKKDVSIGLGHTRLSIIDTSSEANQPYTNGDMVIAFNGEIYNFITIRDELKLRGHQFQTTSDTEVILAAYKEWGIDSFKALRGMFAFALYDASSKSVYVCRDELGIKPLYYRQNENVTVFGSEIKSLAPFFNESPTLSRLDMFEFFNVGFVSEPNTGFNEVKKINPGTVLELNLINGESSSYRLVDLEDLDVDAFDNEIDLEAEVANSIKSHTAADVPIGVFFSGGVDSSVLASETENLPLFFVDYGAERIEEYQHAKNISRALGAKLQVCNVGGVSEYSNPLNSVDLVAMNTEEPISDYTFFASYSLSQIAQKHGYKVMLSGMGADELLLGYPRYKLVKFRRSLKLVNKFKIPQILAKLAPGYFNQKLERFNSYFEETSPLFAYFRLLGYYSTAELQMIFDDSACLREQLEENIFKKVGVDDKNTPLGLKEVINIDQVGFLAHNLTVADKSSMLAGIELRVPFIDKKLFDAKFSSSRLGNITLSKSKRTLLKILGKKLNLALFKRKKVGFNPPLKPLVDDIGEREFLLQLENIDDYIDIDVFKNLINEHFKGSKDHSYKLWQLIYFCRWFKFNVPK